LIKEIENSTPYTAEIEGVDISPLLNVSVEGLKLYKSKENSIFLDTVTVSPSLVSLAIGSPKFPFEARLLGGEVSGIIRLDKKNGGINEIEARLDRVAIDTLPAFISQSGNNVPKLGGVLDGQLHVKLGPQADGDFRFTVNGLNIENVKVKGFTLPGFKGLNSVFKGTIEGDTTKIEELSVNGKDIDLMITGTAPLLWEIPKGGLLDLGYRLEMRGPQMAKYKSILTPYLAAQGDGSLGGKILGTVNNPRFEKGAVKRF
jgi:type II secretion system protein N